MKHALPVIGWLDPATQAEPTQAQDEDVMALRTALLEGERSGPPEPFDPAEFKRAMRQPGG